MANGITFPNQLIPAEAEGAAMAAALSDGILRGCGLSYSGCTLTIAAGHLIVAGRIAEIASAEAVSITATSGYARVKAHIDTGLASTSESNAQFAIEVDYAGTATGFDALTQDDINGSANGIYEATICILSCGASAITGIVSTMGAAGPIIPSGGVATVKIADGAVTTDKIANGAVTEGKIADGTIAYADLAASTVTSIRQNVVTSGTSAPGTLSVGQLYVRYSS